MPTKVITAKLDHWEAHTEMNGEVVDLGWYPKTQCVPICANHISFGYKNCNWRSGMLPGILRTPDIWVIWDHHSVFCSVFLDMLFDPGRCGSPDGAYSDSYELVQKSIPQLQLTEHQLLMMQHDSWMFLISHTMLISLPSIYRMLIPKDWVVPTTCATYHQVWDHALGSRTRSSQKISSAPWTRPASHIPQRWVAFIWGPK